MDELLPPAPQEVPGPPSQDASSAAPDEPTIVNAIDALKAIKLISRPLAKSAANKARQRFPTKYKRYLEKASLKSVVNKFQFHRHRNFLLRKTVVPPEMLQKAIARDQELKRLEKLSKVPRKVIQGELQRRWLESRLKRPKARLAELREQAKPVVAKLAIIDRKIQSVIRSIEYVKFNAKLQRAPTARDYTLRRARRIEQVRQSCAKQLAARARQVLMMKHGVWRAADPTNKQPATLEQLKSVRVAAEALAAKRKKEKEQTSETGEK